LGVATIYFNRGQRLAQSWLKFSQDQERPRKIWLDWVRLKALSRFEFPLSAVYFQAQRKRQQF